MLTNLNINIEIKLFIAFYADNGELIVECIESNALWAPSATNSPFNVVYSFSPLFHDYYYCYLVAVAAVAECIFL